MVGIAGAVLVYLWLTGFAGKGTTIPTGMETQLKVEAVKINGTNDIATMCVWKRQIFSHIQVE